MDSRIYILTHKRLTGQLSAAENTELERLNLIPENKTVSEEISYLWNVSNNYFPTRDWNKDDAKNAFYKRIRSAEPTVVLPVTNNQSTHSTPFSDTSSKGFDWRYIAGIAAALVLALIVWGVSSQGTEEYPEIKSVDEIHYAEILDDTKVWLDEGSSIQILEESADARKVALTGEAFFDVLHNPAKPFTIDLGNDTYAEVLGTSFKARSTHNDQNGRIIVREGRVKLYNTKDPSYSMILEAGEEGEMNLDNEVAQKSQSFGSSSLHASGKMMIFKDAQLQDVLETLGMRFGVSFAYTAVDNITCPYTATIPSYDSIEEILDVIERVYPTISFVQLDRSIIQVEGVCVE